MLVALLADQLPTLDASPSTFAILGGAVGLKFGLYLFCVSMRSHSATMLALAEDHLNDIMRWVAHITRSGPLQLPIMHVPYVPSPHQHSALFMATFEVNAL